jgi:hypothetical protein
MRSRLRRLIPSPKVIDRAMMGLGGAGALVGMGAAMFGPAEGHAIWNALSNAGIPIMFVGAGVGGAGAARADKRDLDAAAARPAAPAQPHHQAPNYDWAGSDASGPGTLLLVNVALFLLAAFALGGG